MQNSSFFRLCLLAKEVIRFAVAGGICLTVGMLIQWVFSGVIGLYYLWGYAVAVLVTSIMNWAINRAWTFGSRDSGKMAEIVRHQGVTWSMLVLSTGLFIVCVSVFNIHYLTAHFLISTLMLGVNFFLQRWLVFRKR